jgi:hypothetical protein
MTCCRSGRKPGLRHSRTAHPHRAHRDSVRGPESYSTIPDQSQRYSVIWRSWNIVQRRSFCRIESLKYVYCNPQTTDPERYLVESDKFCAAHRGLSAWCPRTLQAPCSTPSQSVCFIGLPPSASHCTGTSSTPAEGTLAPQQFG